jgi:hypothetical protein
MKQGRQCHRGMIAIRVTLINISRKDDVSEKPKMWGKWLLCHDQHHRIRRINKTVFSRKTVLNFVTRKLRTMVWCSKVLRLVISSIVNTRTSMVRYQLLPSDGDGDANHPIEEQHAFGSHFFFLRKHLLYF